MPHQWKVHDWFALEKLKRYQSSDGTKWPLRVKPPPHDLVLVEGQREFEVAQILGHRPAKCKRGLPHMQWLVRWKGFGLVEDQWRNYSDLNTEGSCDQWSEYDERARAAEMGDGAQVRQIAEMFDMVDVTRARDWSDAPSRTRGGTVQWYR
jgi:hypothetical protein